MLQRVPCDAGSPVVNDDMDQPPDRPIAPPPVQSADALLVLREMLRTGEGSTESPEIRFLAMLAIRKPTELRRVDVEQLAAAMVSWRRRHLRSGAAQPSRRYIRASDDDPDRERPGHQSPATLGAVDLFGGLERHHVGAGGHHVGPARADAGQGRTRIGGAGAEAGHQDENHRQAGRAPHSGALEPETHQTSLEIEWIAPTIP